jgi:hypothetical protein
MDAYNLSRGNHDIEFVKRCRNISTSSSISHILAANDIDSEFWPVSCYNYEEFAPEPLGDDVYYYHGRKELYGYNIVKDIEAITDYKIHYVDGWQGMTGARTRDLYAKCFIGLRPKDIDGLSNTGIELGLMGRMMIHNGDAPNNIHYNPYNALTDIVRKMDDIMLNPGDVREVSQATRDFIEIGDKWLTI